MKLSFTPAQRAELESWLTYYPYPIMGLLEALRCVQTWHLCITAADEAYLAELFETTVSHVHQAVTFFPLFTQTPTGKHRIGLCHGLSCAMAGADRMARCLERTLGVSEGETTPDGRFSWEQMECVGACDHAPALLVDERLEGQATEDSLTRLAEKLK